MRVQESAVLRSSAVQLLLGPSHHLSGAYTRSLVSNRVKMLQGDFNPESQTTGVPFIRKTTAELTCNDLPCKAPAKSFSIWGTLDARPSSLLPGHEKPVLLRRTVDVNN